jgi:hypothetical protein
MLVARVTVVREHVTRRQSHHDFESSRLTVPTEHGHFRPWRHAFRLQRDPDELVQVDDDLVWPKREGLGVGPWRPLRPDEANGDEQQREEGDDEDHTVCGAYLLGRERVCVHHHPPSS